jgi:L-asparaginase
VTAVCAGTVHGAVDVQKVHTYRLDAFASGDAGRWAMWRRGSVRLRAWPPESAVRRTRSLRGEPRAWPRVEIVMSHAGASGATHRGARAPATGVPAADGLVLAATGNGTLHHALEAAALQGAGAGVAVVRARVARTGILPKAGATLRDAGALTPVKARIALMLELLK